MGAGESKPQLATLADADAATQRQRRASQDKSLQAATVVPSTAVTVGHQTFPDHHVTHSQPAGHAHSHTHHGHSHALGDHGHAHHAHGQTAPAAVTTTSQTVETVTVDAPVAAHAVAHSSAPGTAAAASSQSTPGSTKRTIETQTEQSILAGTHTPVTAPQAHAAPVPVTRTMAPYTNTHVAGAQAHMAVDTPANFTQHTTMPLQTPQSGTVPQHNVTHINPADSAAILAAAAAAKNTPTHSSTAAMSPVSGSGSSGLIIHNEPSPVSAKAAAAVPAAAALTSPTLPLPSVTPTRPLVAPSGVGIGLWDTLIKWASPLLPHGIIAWDEREIAEIVLAISASELLKAKLLAKQMERKLRRKKAAEEAKEAAAKGLRSPPLMSPKHEEPMIGSDESPIKLPIPYDIASSLLTLDKTLSAIRLQWVPSRVSEDTFFVQYFTAVVAGLDQHVNATQAKLTGKQGGLSVAQQAALFEQKANTA